MSDPTTLAGWLLVAGPVLGLIPVGHPALLSIWSMPPDAFAATAAAHRAAWASLNAGFTLATVITAGGLVALASATPDLSAAAVTLSCAVAYVIGCTLWCVVLAIRTRTTPLLADLGGDVITSREGVHPRGALAQTDASGIWRVLS